VNNFLWYVGRATGIVAMILAATSLLFGLLFSGRETGRKKRPAWWLDLHNWLGGLAVAFTVFHMFALLADSDMALSLVTLFVPNTAKDGTAGITWGVLATYAMVIPAVTGLARFKRRIPRKVWHIVHLISVPGVLFAGLHGYISGSDRSTTGYKALTLGLLALSVYAGALRLLGIRARKQASVSASG
jgi:methionine sulfoxide reductase heme-binding subunit